MQKRLENGRKMKVGIVGAVAVGSACLLSVVMRASAREVVLVNRDRERAQGIVTDTQYGTVLWPPISVRAGDYSDLAESSVVMITAGVNEKGGATDRSHPLILVVTDPPDALADVVRIVGHERVLSTGTCSTHCVSVFTLHSLHQALPHLAD
jgi:L-lactate dehydrogenase